ncbi:hypothetical protein O7599_13670 [Streptomyces sp. WMMC500]|uniref:hypothetical protein n=1 Tax=Streptomyces sp. WMMC500 TaxID=3015154 RepID=UPI00248BE840|nr:hypothetical protein [Streptomyces sp. WMMC500]WBB63500.1 hypothetical protein O7599_13670 [Streptomyces sp. WMMC500]
MSKSDNARRLAKQIRRQTLLTRSTSLRLARQVHTFSGSDIPDAADRSQRQFEARVAHCLADAFQDRQLNGALLGVTEAHSTDRGLTIHLEPEMSREVLRAVLPRMDEEYGGLRGVPALRISWGGQHVALYDTLSPAHIKLSHGERAFDTLLPNAHNGEHLLWRSNPRKATKDERNEWLEWDTWFLSQGQRETRDLLFSRILRRPTLVNRAAAPHGLANCYTHHPGDLVIEWCCGDTTETLCAVLLAHNFVDGLPPEKSVELFPSLASVQFGDSTVILRRHNTCVLPNEMMGSRKLSELIREDYTS